MKKFTIPCDFSGVKFPFNFYVGEPAADAHPNWAQAHWLRDERGGEIPPEVTDSFLKLLDIALENNVSFEELCVYALGTAEADSAAEGSADQGQAEASAS
jgi:Domain of unknown function (DUF2610)